MSFKFKLRAPLEPTESMGVEYDLVIVGGGPAGLTAALYSTRYFLKAIVITERIGGCLSEIHLVDNYLGFPSISGTELVEKFVTHISTYGVPIVVDRVTEVTRNGSFWIVSTEMGRRLKTRAVIIAIGSKRKRLGVPGEDRLIGRGVSYCAACDGPLFKDKVVAVIGGGNSALSSSIYLANICSKVYLVHRRNSFKAFPVYVEMVKSNPRIELFLNSIVKEIIGEERVEAIKVLNVVEGRESVVKVDGVFVEIGLEPDKEFFKKIGLEVDDSGHAVVKPDMSTNLPGIFVAGDAAGGPYKYRFEQVIIAAAEGAIAADAAFKYILKTKASTTQSIF
ncbi:MAG: FAD-dependent oxidoreductase [Desulfurococcaceae archaeon]|nr:FAD-dependent oxidoreductase [Sulfolobales archaeon]MDW8170524.1 FAD-dependent oxidoreductase [Desulfurococcaceae archaeon]